MTHSNLNDRSIDQRETFIYVPDSTILLLAVFKRVTPVGLCTRQLKFADPGGHSNGKRGYQARPWAHKKHPNHVFFRYENRPNLCVFACICLNLSVMSFPKFVYMTQNTPFFPILHVFAPLNPGGATQVWFGWGRTSETWKVDPFLYQILPKNETHFYTRATNFKQKLLKISHYFPKLLSFQANFGNFGIRLMKLGLFLRQFEKILKIWPMFIPVFALNKGTSLYQEADFETHFSGTSPDRPLY